MNYELFSDILGFGRFYHYTQFIDIIKKVLISTNFVSYLQLDHLTCLSIKV